MLQKYLRISRQGKQNDDYWGGGSSQIEPYAIGSPESNAFLMLLILKVPLPL